MKENLFVFDIDDTLTKSEFQHQFAYVETMKHFGITDINENWATYEHMTDSHILKKNYEANLEKPFSFDFIPGFEEKMTQSISKLKPVIEIKGANAFIQQVLEDTNFGVCFATGSLLKPALLKLQQAKIAINTDLVVGSNHHFSREELVQKAIELAKGFYKVSDFKHIISIGDGIWDWRTAKNLGLHFIGIGPKNKADFESQNIPVHIDNWTDFDVATVLKKLGI